VKTIPHCHHCLKGLAEKTVGLSEGDGTILGECLSMISTTDHGRETPPAIANRVLKHIRKRTNVYDPYLTLKKMELEQALASVEKTLRGTPETFEDLLRLSALGNATDFFVQERVDSEEFPFVANVDKIKKEIYNKGKDVLFLGDNISDFIFDVPLLNFLEKTGKRVAYAAKEHPVQNDLSMPDVSRFGLRSRFDSIISTGTDGVGIARDEMEGIIKDMWEGDTVVIAKGMGNFETISEFHSERPVIHIMKVKCPAVADAVQEELGTYIVMVGGE
jgi:uncharacterized protein with ATP-grasp and redox domains